MPETDTLAPSIVLKLDGSLSQIEARALLQAFLSTLAWARNAKIMETFSTFSTGAPIGIGKSKPGSIRSNAPMDYLPDPSDRKARLALGLYREALSVNIPAYALLGYFKVINTLFKSGDDQKEWIRKCAPKLTDRDAVKRLAKIQAEQSDIGAYLYVSGRCAVAHAHADPIADPDDPSDQQRLASDLPVMKGSLQETDIYVR